MRKALVAGNWKMHGRVDQNLKLIEALIPALSNLKEAVDIVVCPPLVYLSQVNELIANTSIALGAQDVSRFDRDGAHTGDCSADMLADVGASYVLVGHSERRSEQNDTDERVSQKLACLLKANLKPILCVGETLEQREAGQVEDVIATQIELAISGLSVDDLKELLIAYEPVWAIGTGKTASPEQAQDVHAYIRELLGARFGSGFAKQITILYGGSVKAANAAELFGQPDIDGGLIGGAALITEEFTAICSAAANSPKNG
ncbi:MAG: triose-phosphate isomerase [Nitrincola sp.]|nr:triose-phosphate isomerase [Nitrincola sp.]